MTYGEGGTSIGLGISSYLAGYEAPCDIIQNLGKVRRIHSRLRRWISPIWPPKSLKRRTNTAHVV